MSRVIKFRAWDGKTMRYDLTGLEHGKGNEMSGVFLDGDFYGNIPLMQFTGLHDKNGVEIYEGDIISDHVGIGCVRHSDDHGAFRVSYGNGRAKWFYDYLDAEIKTIEVIGNIYQNPELLNRSSESD